MVQREMPKPVEVKPKARVGGPTTEALPRRAEGASMAAMGQWAGGPTDKTDKRSVVVDEGPVRGRRSERPETVATTPVISSADAGGDVGRLSADKEERVMPAFDVKTR